ncbi:hypothetical protein [Mesorhizobium sp. ZC-5]|uniref:hypothetical protein n=1 Tax=Mesorhizobium sp. ZC-5 TaxID=2986066 RepID=UPI0021E8D9D9|nr:hypothetical protein [Mesorhizobium sp. ZC-5]MCV3242454.1 hypothetical protein [Mesorhizobium sp. ZC-5]
MSLQTSSIRNSAAVLALVAAAFAATPAAALSDSAKLKSMSFNVEADHGIIRVISTDGEKWDKLKAGAVALDASFSINTKWPGFVQTATIRLGSCGGMSCFSFPQLWFKNIEERDYSGSAITGFQTSLLPISSSDGIAINPAADAILSRCNEHLQADGPTKSYSFTQEMYATLAIDTDESLNMNFIHNQPDEVGGPSQTAIDHTDSDAFSVNVICEPVIKSPVSDLKHDFGEFDVENVKLFLTTYQSNQPGSNPGTVCPALKVTSRAEANQAGPVTMRIWRQKDDGPITSEVKQAWASFDAAKNGYFATYEKWEDVGTTSYFQFKTEIVEAGPFGPFDGWKDITVHCTSPGGGGFTDVPQDNPDLPKPKAEWQGEVTVADSAGRDKSCPRKGQVFFAVTRAAPGDFDYRIQCSNGAFFTGTATGYDQGSGVFEAYGAHDLSINRTRSIQCTLQELQPAPVTVDTDKEDFTCNNPNFDPAADDLVVDTRPHFDEPEPTVPPVVVDPGRKCLPHQQLKRGKCVDRPVVAPCKANEKRVGNKCIPVSIHCLPGFHQVGLKCVPNPSPPDKCKRNEVRINGRCVKKPDVSILCKPGFVLKGKTCVRKPTVEVPCKRGEQRINGKCVKKPDVTILCKKGFKPVGKTCVRQATITKLCPDGRPMIRGNWVKKPVAVPLRTLTAPKRTINRPTIEKPFKRPVQKRILRRAN